MKRINVQGPFNDELAGRVVRAIRAAGGLPIDLRIDSSGGNFGAAIEICLEIEEHSAPVFTTIVGQAFSAAGVLAIAGDVRRIDRGGVVMLHYPSPPSREGTLRAREMVQEYTRQPMDDIITWLVRERPFTAADAVQHGLADRVIDASASEPVVRLWEAKKRAPTAWLRRYREDFERHDLRVRA